MTLEEEIVAAERRVDRATFLAFMFRRTWPGMDELMQACARVLKARVRQLEGGA